MNRKQAPPTGAAPLRGPLNGVGRTVLALLVLVLTACGGAKPTAGKGAGAIDPESGAPINASGDKRAQITRIFMEATQARLGGQIPKAASLYQQCLKLDPANDAAHFELAKLYHQGQNFPAAVDHAKRAVAADKENIWYRFLLADLYAQNRQTNEAAAVYREVLAKWPDRYEVYFDLANMLAYGGKVDEAIKVYNEQEQRFGLSEELIMQEFGMLSQTGRMAEAQALVERAIKVYPNQPQYMGLLAELYDQQGQHDKALEQYKRTLELDPDNSMLRIALAEHYYTAGKMEEAYDELGLAFLDPDLDIDAKMQVLIGFFEMTEREGEKPEDRPDLIRRSYTLIEALEKAHPESGKPHTIHGDFLMRDGKLAEARDQFREALRTEKERFPIHMQLLQLDLQLRDYNALHKDAEEAISIFPTVPEPYLYNGIALSQLGKHDEAVETLITGRDVVVDNPPLLAQFWSSLGDAYHEAARHTDSDKAYDKALAMEPNNSGTLNNYAYYLSVRNTQLEKAERMSKRSLEITPGSATYMDTYAWVLFRLGRYADARTWIEKAIAAGEADGVVVEHYGDILYELGDKSGAMAQWRKAKDLGDASDAIDRKINEGIRVE
ncbi:MAG: tetratricopeptide repeat protein [Flavobacteriales bacterium]|nr:tetratricopeptide repeat protein [Flavobacteriales bacterium]